MKEIQTINRPSILLLAIFILMNSFAFGQWRKYSNAFLEIGVGARGMALSGATVATTNDVTSAYWNPAGLVHSKNDLQLGLMHSQYFSGIGNYNYAGVSRPMKSEGKYIGFSMIRLSIDNIPNTMFLVDPADNSINYDRITTFSAVDNAFLISYAQEMPMEGLVVGGNAKIIHRWIGEFATSWGFGIDVGAQLKRENWRFGAVAKDLTNTFNAWSISFTEEEEQILAITGNDIPGETSYEYTQPRLVLGAAYDFKVWKKRISLVPEANLEITSDGKRNTLISANPFSIDPRVGLDVSYQDVLYFRAGIGKIQRATEDYTTNEITTFQPNMGIGLRIKSIALDYALSDIANMSQVLYSHTFSIIIDINRKVAAKIEE